MGRRVNGALLAIAVVIVTSAASADEPNKRSEVRLGFGGWTAQGDKIERTQGADGRRVVKITGNVLLWTRDRDGKATVASMDSLECSDTALTLKGYPVVAEGEWMIVTSSHLDPEYALTVKDGKITSRYKAELSGTLGETGGEQAAVLDRMIKIRKETVRLKLAEIIKDAQQGVAPNP